eukprot:6934764-Pyramimonas_sp.AAC.1
MVNLLLRKGATQAWPRARIVARRSLAGTGALVRHYPACLWVTSRVPSHNGIALLCQELFVSADSSPAWWE